MGIHVAYMSLVNVNKAGVVVNKNLSSTTINEVIKCATEIRVMQDANLPNTSGYPTIADYLTAEVADGYSLLHMSQTIIVTDSCVTDVLDAPLEALGDELISDLSSAVGLTVPDGAEYAWIQANGNNVRLRDSGVPTSTNGVVLIADSQPLFYSASLSTVQFIEVAASASLFVSYYKRR